MNKTQLLELLVKVANGQALDFDQLAQQHEPLWKLLGFDNPEGHNKSIKT